MRGHSPREETGTNALRGSSLRPASHARIGSQTVEVPPFASATPTAHTDGQTDLMANHAGQGVGLIHNLLPAADIVEQILSQAQAIIRRLSTMLA